MISFLLIIPNLYSSIHSRFLILNPFNSQNSPYVLSVFTLLHMVNYTYLLSNFANTPFFFFTSFAIFSLVTLKDPSSICSAMVFLNCYSNWWWLYYQLFTYVFSKLQSVWTHRGKEFIQFISALSVGGTE